MSGGWLAILQLLCYNGYIMKKVKSILQKVRPKNGTDIYYTYSHWPIEEIDGEKFLAVTKTIPNPKEYGAGYYMKKDNMEYVK